MTALVPEIDNTDVLSGLKRQCDSEEGRAIFDSPDLADFSDEEYRESHPDASYRDIAIARAGHDAKRVLAEGKAKDKCLSCSFRAECLQNAYQLEEHDIDITQLSPEDPLPIMMYGVVGGLNQKERSVLFASVRE